MLLFLGRQTLASPVEVMFGIREESRRIPCIKNTPIVIRTGILEKAGVYLIPVVLQLRYKGFPATFFEVWLNVSPPESFGAELFHYLCHQARIVLQFFGDTSLIARVLVLPNNIAQWQALKLTIDPQKSWSMDVFDRARDQIFTRFPTPQDLFFHLGQPQVRKVWV